MQQWSPPRHYLVFSLPVHRHQNRPQELSFLPYAERGRIRTLRLDDGGILKYSPHCLTNDSHFRTGKHTLQERV